MTRSSDPRGAVILGGSAGVLAVALLLTAMQPAVGRGPDFAVEDDLVRTAMSESGVPGAAYAIVRDGRVAHVAALGSAGPDGRPMTTRTPIVIGSVGKSITALAIRQLVEAGAIDLDAPVRRYLPWFSLAGPDAAAERVTIRSLLEHTSGLSTALGQDPRWYAADLSGEMVVRGLASARADVDVGTYAYSNVNYVVLGAVVEAVSGLSYGEFVRTRIFDPLSMSRSFTSLPDAAAAVPAQGHRYLFGIALPFDEPYPTGMVAAGYQVSTAEDMGRFAAALANGGVVDGVDVVGARDRSGAAGGLGTDWRPLAPGDAGAIVSQSGSTLTSNAVLLVVPSRREGVVVLFNANPTQFLGMPAGAADVALGIVRLSMAGGPATSAPTVRAVYLVVDAVLLALVAAFIVHAYRARTWRRRMTEPGRHRFLMGRTVVADLILPLAVLVGVPLWIGSTGSSPAGDVPAGWRFIVWTLPDIALTLLAITLAALALGIVKIVSLRARATGLPAASPDPFAPRPAGS